MKRLSYFLFLSISLMLVSWSISAQITSQEVNAAMGRGINIGNTMEPEKEGGWNNGVVQEYYFDDYKAAGFTSIRIPVRWDKHTSGSSPYKIDETWMNRVEQVVNWGLERDLYIVINAHHEEWIKTGYANKNLRDRFDSIWSQIAVRFQGKSEKLLFEIINEPNGLTQANVNDLNARALSIIRKTNPTRTVLYSGYMWSNSDQLMSAAVPNDPYIIGYFHSYDPWSFAGEANGTWGTTADISSLKTKFETVGKWSKSKNVPVTINEFGAISGFRDASGKVIRIGDYNSRMLHYSCYTEFALKNGLSFNVWDDGGDFGIYQRKNRTWTDVKDILIYSSDTTTNNLKIQQSEAGLTLSWTLRSNAIQSIDIERKPEGGTFKSIATIDFKSTSYNDTTALVNKYNYYRVVAKYANGKSIPSYPIRGFKIATERSSFGAAPFQVPGTIQAEDFDKGGEGLTYHDIDFTNSAAKYRNDVGVDIESRSDGGYQVTETEAGEWLEYTINISEEAEYNIDTWVASVEGGGKIVYSVGKVSIPSITVPKTSSKQTLAKVTATKILKAGEQIMRLKILAVPTYNVDRIEISRTTTSVDDLGSGRSISVFSDRPNVLSVNQIGAEKQSISVYNLNGQLVFKGEILQPENEIILPSSGIHLYQTISASGKISKGKIQVM